MLCRRAAGKRGSPFERAEKGSCCERCKPQAREAMEPLGSLEATQAYQQSALPADGAASKTLRGMLHLRVAV